MKKNLVTLLLFFGVIHQVTATNYYVRTDGNDSNNGLSNTPAGAWRSINTALYGYANWGGYPGGNQGVPMLPGDTLWVNDGYYQEDGYTFGLKIDGIMGTNTNRFVLKAINKGAVQLELTSQFNAFNIINSKGIVIDGFDIFAPANSTNIHSGIIIDDSEFVTIRNCKLHNFGLSGVGGNGQNIIIENNIVFNNSIRNPGNGSGINFYHPKKISNNTLEGGYGHIIRGNTVYGNYCEFFYTNVNGNFGPPTDGNGIILDDWNFTQQLQGAGVPYIIPALIENNICFNNGGSGITIYNTSNVTIRNNTIFKNSWVVSQYASVEYPASGILALCEPGFGDNITIENNISMTDPNLHPLVTMGISSKDVTNITIKNNYIDKLSFPLGPVPTPNIIGTNPEFVNPSINPLTTNFRLLNSSPVINAGFNSNAPTIDFDGNPRPFDGTVDIGAFEYQNVISICFPPGVTGVALESTLGITTLDRGNDSNWITSRKNGYLVLESKTKGFVIPVMNHPETTIIPAMEGMIVYDSDNFVIKLYNGTTWISIVQSCN
jgi:parallel beta-helix repeat protein